MKYRGWARDAITVITVALLFFVVTMPFRAFFQVLPVTEVRPASAFNPVFGLLFGFPGALGCMLGNLAADLMSGYSPALCAWGAAVQLVYGMFPYWVWGRRKAEIRLHTSSNVLKYMVVMLADSGIAALFLGLALNITVGSPVFTMTTLLLFLNNFVFCMVLGIPMMLIYTAKTRRKSGKGLSINERFILFFLLMAIFSAVIIGLVAYIEIDGHVTDMLDLWNRVYIWIATYLFVFCALIVAFLRYAEKHITVPMETLATAAKDYISGENDGRPDAERIRQECSAYTRLPGEAGALAEAFLEMSTNLEQYIVNLTKVTAERERIGAELDVATRIQADLLPNHFPAFPERKDFQIYASMKPAKEVGGDFYDFFLVDQDHLALVIADVSDKGVPAALFMAIAKTLIQNQTLTGQSPRDILMKVNNQLCENNREKMFVTVWMGILDLPSGKLTAVNAGHEYPAMRRSGEAFTLLKDKHGLVMAAMKNVRYTEYELQLGPGDTLFVYTDGVPEAANCANAFFGTERMLEALNRESNAAPEQLVHNVGEGIAAYVDGARQFDDITMLCLQYFGTAPGQGETRRFPAQVACWEDALAFINEFLAGLGCAAKERMQIDTAAEEIFVNIAQYAYPDHKGEIVVDVSLVPAEESVELVFRDQGIPWNPLEKPDADVTLPPEQRKIGGLGIFMVKKLMDHTAYAYIGNENVFTMRKRITQTEKGT